MSRARDVSAALAAMPYAVLLGIEGEVDGSHLTLRLPFRDDLVGNQVLPALHGGLIGAFLEITALLTLGLDSEESPRTIGVTVEYLRPGRPKTTFARASIHRIGARIANVHVSAWQEDPAAPIALLQGRFLMNGEGDDGLTDLPAPATAR